MRLESETDYSIFASKYGSSAPAPSGASMLEDKPEDVTYFRELEVAGKILAQSLIIRPENKEFALPQYPHLPNIGPSRTNRTPQDLKVLASLGLTSSMPEESPTQKEVTIPLKRVFFETAISPSGEVILQPALARKNNPDPITQTVEDILEVHRPHDLPSRTQLLKAALVRPDIHPIDRTNGKKILVVTNVAAHLAFVSDPSLIRSIRSLVANEPSEINNTIREHACLYWASMVPLYQHIQDPCINNPSILIPVENLHNPLIQIPN